MAVAKISTKESTSAKKTLTRKSVNKEVADTVETVKKSVKKDDKKVEAKAKKPVKDETSKKSKDVKESKKTDEVKEVVEKAAKKINVKETIADTCGLNLSVAKVKNVISNHCINKEVIDAVTELKESRIMHECKDPHEEGAKVPLEFTFALKNLSDKTLAYLDLCHEHVMIENGLAFSRKFVNSLNKKEKDEYNTKKREASIEFQKSQKTTNLFNQDKFDLTAFNLKYNPKFYDKMDKTDSEWKKLKNEELYKYCSDLVNKSKVRFNSDSRIFITAFIEYIIKQLVINGTINCVNDNKKIIQLEHAINNIGPEFKLFPFIQSTTVYKKAQHIESEEESEEDDEEHEAEAEIESTADELEVIDKKLQFKYYVGEICRQNRMELSKADESADNELKSKFNQTSVSKKFKQFCSDAIIELLKMFGNVLKTEVVTREVKTVNYAIVSALVYNSHTLHNLESKQTVEFVQEKYNIYNEYIQKKIDTRAETAPKAKK